MSRSKHETRLERLERHQRDRQEPILTPEAAFASALKGDATTSEVALALTLERKDLTDRLCVVACEHQIARAVGRHRYGFGPFWWGAEILSYPPDEEPPPSLRYDIEEWARIDPRLAHTRTGQPNHIWRANWVVAKFVLIIFDEEELTLRAQLAHQPTIDFVPDLFNTYEVRPDHDRSSVFGMEDELLALDTSGDQP